MILIADSGSTKTHWRLLDVDNIKQHETIGLHPSFIDERVVKSVINPLAERYPNVNEVFFYGSGCTEGSSGQTFMQTELQICFQSAKVYVNSDLLGAAKALWKHLV